MEFGMIGTNGKIFVSKDFDKYSPFIFSITLQDHSPNTMMINSLKKYNFWKTFLENFKLGNDNSFYAVKEESGFILKKIVLNVINFDKVVKMAK